MEQYSAVHRRSRTGKILPPVLKEVVAKISAHHPRVWLDKDEWDNFISRNTETQLFTDW